MYIAEAVRGRATNCLCNIREIRPACGLNPNHVVEELKKLLNDALMKQGAIRQMHVPVLQWEQHQDIFSLEWLQQSSTPA